MSNKSWSHSSSIGNLSEQSREPTNSIHLLHFETHLPFFQNMKMVPHTVQNISTFKAEVLLGATILTSQCCWFLEAVNTCCVSQKTAFLHIRIKQLSSYVVPFLDVGDMSFLVRRQTRTALTKLLKRERFDDLRLFIFN